MKERGEKYKLPKVRYVVKTSRKINWKDKINYSDLLNKPSNATQFIAGLMTVEDKKKLDGIATGANAYVLPSANSERLGGIKISFSNGVLTITT